MGVGEAIAVRGKGKQMSGNKVWRRGDGETN